MVPLTLSNVAQTGRPDRLDRGALASAKIVGAAVLAMPVFLHLSANAEENSPRLTLEHHACAVIMGLRQPGDLDDTCIRSLDKTLSELDRAQLVATDRSACAQHGLGPHTSAFAVCAANAEQL